jgi:hypothetical protein
MREAGSCRNTGSTWSPCARSLTATVFVPAGSVTAYHTVAPKPGAAMGSPASEVAPTLVPATIVSPCTSAVAAVKLSLAGGTHFAWTVPPATQPNALPGMGLNPALQRVHTSSVAPCVAFCVQAPMAGRGIAGTLVAPLPLPVLLAGMATQPTRHAGWQPAHTQERLGKATTS